MKPSPLRVVAALAVLALTAAALYAAVYKRLHAQIGLREASTMTARARDRQTPAYLRSTLARDALTLLAGLRSSSPDDQRAAMLRGSNQLSLGRPDDAEQSFLEALRWGERPEIYVVLAAAQAANGKEDAAIASLDRALAFDPSSLINVDRADLRAEVLRRFEARSTPAQRAEVYLSIAIGYFEDGFNDEGVETAAQAILHDERILRRPELVGWGYLFALSRDRALELRRARGLGLTVPR